MRFQTAVMGCCAGGNHDRPISAACYCDGGTCIPLGMHRSVEKQCYQKTLCIPWNANTNYNTTFSFDVYFTIVPCI